MISAHAANHPVDIHRAVAEYKEFIEIDLWVQDYGAVICYQPPESSIQGTQFSDLLDIVRKSERKGLLIKLDLKRGTYYQLFAYIRNWQKFNNVNWPASKFIISMDLQQGIFGGGKPACKPEELANVFVDIFEQGPYPVLSGGISFAEDRCQSYTVKEITGAYAVLHQVASLIESRRLCSKTEKYHQLELNLALEKNFVVPRDLPLLNRQLRGENKEKRKVGLTFWNYARILQEEFSLLEQAFLLWLLPGSNIDPHPYGQHYLKFAAKRPTIAKYLQNRFHKGLQAFPEYTMNSGDNFIPDLKGHTVADLGIGALLFKLQPKLPRLKSKREMMAFFKSTLHHFVSVFNS